MQVAADAYADAADRWEQFGIVPEQAFAPASAEGRMRMGIIANLAEFESARKGERVARAAEQRAASGRPHGRPSYGWTLDGAGKWTIEPDQTAMIRSRPSSRSRWSDITSCCRRRSPRTGSTALRSTLRSVRQRVRPRQAIFPAPSSSSRTSESGTGPPCKSGPRDRSDGVHGRRSRRQDCVHPRTRTASSTSSSSSERGRACTLRGRPALCEQGPSPIREGRPPIEPTTLHRLSHIRACVSYAPWLMCVRTRKGKVSHRSSIGGEVCG